MPFLSARNGLITQGGKPVHLKGVNLGGWLMPEGYFVHAPNRGYHLFQAGFLKACGPKTLHDLEREFRAAYIQEEDFARIAALGFNCIRLPFHFALLEESPYVYSHEGVRILDEALRWAKMHGLRVILDMHAVPGAQNEDWHSDSDGKARFWTNRNFQLRACALWEYLAERYKNDPTVAGYDILNEPVLDDPAPLNAYYKRVIKAVRAVDPNHIMFIEGNRWGQDIACLDEFADDNLVLSIHNYVPLEFTFNFMPGLRYTNIDRAPLKKVIDDALALARRSGRALYCGEFGVNSRDGFYGEGRWLSDILAQFNEEGIHWTYWTWKAVKNAMYPDGVRSYGPNPPWVNRQGPLCGWETWHETWPMSSAEMVASWKSEAFVENEAIIKALKTGLR